jgi:hypothetical protein
VLSLHQPDTRYKLSPSAGEASPPEILVYHYDSSRGSYGSKN